MARDNCHSNNIINKNGLRERTLEGVGAEKLERSEKESEPRSTGANLSVEELVGRTDGLILCQDDGRQEENEQQRQRHDGKGLRGAGQPKRTAESTECLSGRGGWGKQQQGSNILGCCLSFSLS